MLIKFTHVLRTAVAAGASITAMDCDSGDYGQSVKSAECEKHWRHMGEAMT